MDDMTRNAGRMAGTASAAMGADDKMRDEAQRTATDTVEQARTMARDFGEQARSMARDFTDQARSMANSAAQALPPQARERAMAAGDMLYRQGSWAGDYLVRQINANPVTATVIAAALGYTLAYMIHSRSA